MTLRSSLHHADDTKLRKRDDVNMQSWSGMTGPSPLVRPPFLATSVASSRSGSPFFVKLVLAVVIGSYWFGHTFPVKAGPWSQNLGQVYLKWNESAFLAQGFRNANGMLTQDVFYAGITSSAYVEVGLGHGFQLQGTLPYTIAINSFQDGARFSQGSFADIQLAAQWTLPWFRPVVMAFRVAVKLPPYDIHTYVNKYPDGGTRFPVHGDGQVDVAAWFSLGGNIPRSPLYGFVELGYQFRTEAFFGTSPNRSFLDSLVLNSQLGWTFWRRMILSLNFRGILALGDDLFSQSYLTLGLGFYLPVWRGLALEVAFDPTIWAKNAAQGFAFSLGLSFRN